MGHGGKRPNSGPKKGAIYKPTLDKIKAREALRLIVLEHMPAMTAAQIAAAQGLKYLVKRAKHGGKFEVVTEEMIKAGILEQDDVTIEVWDKQPSTPAYTDLMNRALDKPTEHHEHTGADGQPLEVLVTRLGSARKRHGQ